MVVVMFLFEMSRQVIGILYYAFYDIMKKFITKLKISIDSIPEHQ
jgi:hypothetical protein